MPYIFFAGGATPYFSPFLVFGAVCSGYNTFSKLVSLIEYSDGLESAQAYCELYDYLTQTPLSYVYDFGKFGETCTAGDIT